MRHKLLLLYFFTPQIPQLRPILMQDRMGNSGSEIGRFRSGKIVAFSIRNQTIDKKLKQNRLGFYCAVTLNSVPAVGITMSLNIRVLTQLRLELLRVQLLYNFTRWMYV